MTKPSIPELKFRVLLNLEESFRVNNRYKELTLHRPLTALQSYIGRRNCDLFYTYNFAAFTYCLFGNWEVTHAFFDSLREFNKDDYYTKVTTAFCILHELELTGYQNPRLTIIAYDAVIDAVHSFMKIDKTKQGFIENRLQAISLICLLTTANEAIENHVDLYSYLKSYIYPGYMKKLDEIRDEARVISLAFFKSYYDYCRKVENSSQNYTPP